MSADQPTFDLLVRGCTALTGDPALGLVRDAVIGITGNSLSLVAPAADVRDRPLSARRTIDGRGLLATPGFVNVHTHTVLTMARGMTEDLGFAPAYTPGVPHYGDVREEEAAALARLGALELMTFGSTLINDFYAHAHVTLPAIAELGLRVCSSAWIHDVDFDHVHEGVWRYDPKIGERSLRYGIEHAERWQGAFDGRTSVMFTPHAPDNCSRDFLRDVAEASRRMDLRVMTHLAQSRIEVAQVRRRDGMTPAELLDDVGLLNDRLIGAHCLVMTESDIARCGAAGIFVAHCPKVNMTGGDLPMTSALRQAGAAIALGTDNMHGDMVEIMRWALASGRLQEAQVNDVWQAEDVFRMATLEGAAAMGRSADLGSLTPGKKADLVLFDFRRPHLAPAFPPLGTLVHVGQGRDVSTVIVDGRVVVENGHATLVDEERIIAEGAAAADAIWTRVTGRSPAIYGRPRFD